MSVASSRLPSLLLGAALASDAVDEVIQQIEELSPDDAERATAIGLSCIASIEDIEEDELELSSPHNRRRPTSGRRR